MDINKDLTFLTPVKLTDNCEWDFFKDSMNSYYSVFKFRPKHNFAIRYSRNYFNMLNSFLKEINCNFEIIKTDVNAIEGWISLIKSSETKYSHLVLSDVKNISNKDFLTPCIESMEKIEDLIQVNVSGYPMGDYGVKNNRDHFILEEGKLTFKNDKNYIFDPFVSSSIDTVWISPLTPDKLDRFFALPFWHTIIKTDIAKRYNASTEPYLTPQDTTISSWLKHGHTSDTIKKSVLKQMGWPKGFDWISQYRQGFLNLCCYLYMIGRERKSVDQFITDHCNEIKHTVSL